jgi:outer membrane protein assembly factor BamE (lipoprotein component of BamABCDE complex)
MKKNILLFVLGLSTLALIGCASTRMGTDFNSANVNKLKVGKTTEQEVIQLIGQPINRTRSADGTVTLQYMYYPGQTIHAFTAITNPGYLQEAGKGQKGLTVIIGSDGKVKDFTESGSQ